MRVWSIGGLAIVLAGISPLVVGEPIPPIAILEIAIAVTMSGLAFVSASALGRHLATGNAADARRGLATLGGWLVLAAVATATWTFGVELAMPGAMS